MSAKKNSITQSDQNNDSDVEEVTLASFLNRPKNETSSSANANLQDDFNYDSYQVLCEEGNDMYIEFNAKPLELEVISYFRRLSKKEQLNVIEYLINQEEAKKEREANEIKRLKKKYMTSDDLVQEIISKKIQDSKNNAYPCPTI
jgi:hypothetical protein